MGNFDCFGFILSEARRMICLPSKDESNKFHGRYPCFSLENIPYSSFKSKQEHRYMQERRWMQLASTVANAGRYRSFHFF